MLAGIVIAFTVLSRTNGISVPVLSPAPWLKRAPIIERVKLFTYSFLPFLGVLLAWGGYALATESSVWPSESHQYLAMTYYSSGPNRISGEARMEVEGQFNSLWSVIAHDPIRMARIYVWDMLRLAKRVLLSNSLILIPVGLLAAVGLPLLAIRERSRLVILYLGATALQILLVNFKAFEARYYLFLIPALGAIGAYALKRSVSSLALVDARRWLIFLSTPLLVIGIAHSVSVAYESVHADDDELGQVIPILKEATDSGDSLFARKPHLAYYT